MKKLEKYQKWESLDANIETRINNLIQSFKKNFNSEPSAIVASPGRAEILGNHTDYNLGQTISANIINNILVAATANNTKTVRVISVDQSDNIISFNINSIQELLDQKSPDDSKDSWSNYIKGVFWSFLKNNHKIEGMDVVVQSTIPMGAGVSSSAAFELAISHAIAQINSLEITEKDYVILAKTAENEYVGSPCGFLDQGTIQLANSNWLIMNNEPTNFGPFSWSNVEMDLKKSGYMLVIGYDPMTKRSLTEGKYALRRQVCFLVLDLINKYFAKNLKSLSQLHIEEFNSIKIKLEESILKDFDTISDINELSKNQSWNSLTKQDFVKRLTRWASHVISDNDKVGKAIVYLRESKVDFLGELFNDSGNSGIYNYELAEDAEELTWVYETVMKNKENWKVLGIRNMGGGFNATTLSLVDASNLENYKNTLKNLYKNEFGTEYLFLDFVPSPAAGVIMINE